MAQIVTITNPLTGQPAQVDQLEHTAQQIDDGIGFESTDYPGCYYRTVGGVTEWVNPPMIHEEEYRTTERYNEKPVYIKAVSIAALPNNAQIAVDLGVTQQTFRPFAFGGNAVSSDGALSYAIPASGNNIAVNDIYMQVFGYRAFIKTNSDWSKYSATVWVKYYKSTD